MIENCQFCTPTTGGHAWSCPSLRPSAQDTNQRIRAVDRQHAKARDYLGDGVYAAHDGFGIWLTAENGIEATDAIYLEPEVLALLVRFAKAARG